MEFSNFLVSSSFKGMNIFSRTPLAPITAGVEMHTSFSLSYEDTERITFYLLKWH